MRSRRLQRVVRRVGLAHVLLVLAVSVLLLAAALVAAVALADADALLKLALMHERVPEIPRFSISDIPAIQFRAALFAVVLTALAALLAGIGPRPWRLVIEDAQALLAQRRRIRRGQAVWLLIATAVTAVLAAAHIGQPMRADESLSFLNHGTRPIFVSLGLYDSTNNHVLHSLFMRASVVLFGSEPWSIRLPAALAVLLSIPALYLAGRRLIDAETGLLAALLAAGAAYTVDLATNARGYPLMHVAFLCAWALLPDVRRRRPAAVAGFVVLGALGAWAVPMMIYPVAIALMWLALEHLRRERGALRWWRLAGVAGVGVGIMTLTGLLYGPALVVVGFDSSGASHQLELAQHDSLAERVIALGVNLSEAWQMWTATWPPAIAWLSLALVAGGVVVLLARGGRSAVLVFAVAGGAGAVLLVTGLAIPPWWAMTFLFPIYLLLAAVLPATLCRRLGGRNTRIAPVKLAALALLVPAASTALSDYPASLPYFVGYRDAELMAETLRITGWVEKPVWAMGVGSSAVNYYLYRAGSGSTVVRRDKAAPVKLPQQLVTIEPYSQSADPGFQRRLREQRLRVVASRRLPHSQVSLRCADNAGIPRSD